MNHQRYDRTTRPRHGYYIPNLHRTDVLDTYPDGYGMTSPPFHVGDFVWCAFPESEHPVRPSRHLHVSYVLATTASISATAIANPSTPPDHTYQCIVAYTTSQSRRHVIGRPGVVSFSAEQAAELGQQRAFWLYLWRVAYLPVTPIWFPRLSELGSGVVGSVSRAMQRELETKIKAVFTRHRPEIEQLGPLRPHDGS